MPIWFSRKKIWSQIGRIVYPSMICSLIFFGTIGVIHAKMNDAAQLHRYVGDESCEICHSSERIGNQFQSWMRSPHARAYTDLDSIEAQNIARKMGIADPQKSHRCLSCHTTASNASLPEMTSSFRKSDGVQCESCHGPGEDYSRYSTMIDSHKATRAGLVAIPDQKTCITCHNPSSPTYKTFNYKKDVQKILHKIPANVPEKDPESE